MKTQTIKELEELIKSANEAYRSGEPVMDDKEYDILVEQLTDIDPENELVKKSVIEEQPTSRKKKLPIPMYSLNKKKSIQEIQDWVKSKGIPEDAVLVITPKYDGISLCVVEEKNQAYTRGDGEFGQQSNYHYLKMNGAGNYTNVITFGEAIISKKNWDKHFKGQINPLTKKPYSNARNTVAGLLGRDITVPELEFVDYVRYGMSGFETSLTKHRQLELLTPAEKSLPRVLFEKILVGDLLNPEVIKVKFEELYSKWSEIYQIDGLVIDVDDPILRKKLGREENMNPAYAIAYKNSEWSSYVDVVIDGHVFEISKQGKLKGTVSFPKTIIGGVEVSNATFYNTQFLTDFCLIKGVTISVKRSGDVIPKIVRVEGIDIPQRENFGDQDEFYAAKELASINVLDLINENDFSDFCDDILICPSCDEPLKWDKTYTELVCTNPNCEEIRVNKIVHFFSTVGVEEFGKPSIKSLYDYGFNSVEKILSMQERDFENILGWGKKSIKIVLDEFKKLEGKIPFARLLHALDLFEGKIGEKTCQSIIDKTDNQTLLSIPSAQIKISEIIDYWINNVSGVSSITAIYFYDGLVEFNNTCLFEFNWRKYISYFESPKKEVTSNKYEGFSVCVSGFRDKELEERIQVGGGKMASGVSKTTTHLILKDSSSTSSKTEKAKQLGVKILTIDQFNAL